MAEAQPRLLRQVDSFDPWRLHVTDPTNWPVGRVPSACLQDFRDRRSSPSFYEVPDEEALNEAASALAAMRMNRSLPTFFGLVLDAETISVARTALTRTPGATPFRSVNARHVELTRATVEDVAAIAVAAFHDAAIPEDLGNSTRPGLFTFGPLEVARTLRRMIEQGKLTQDGMRANLERAIAEALGES